MEEAEISFLETDGAWITVLSQCLYIEELHVKIVTVPLQQVHSECPHPTPQTVTL
jgi:hypothetical protein